MPADAAGPHVQGVEPDTLFTSPGRCWVTSTSSTLDTAKGQLFPNRMLTSLQRHEPGILTYMRCPTSRLPTTLPAGMKKT